MCVRARQQPADARTARPARAALAAGFGRLDIFFANAGVSGSMSYLPDLGVEELNDVFRVRPADPSARRAPRGRALSRPALCVGRGVRRPTSAASSSPSSTLPAR